MRRVLFPDVFREHGSPSLWCSPENLPSRGWLPRGRWEGVGPMHCFTDDYRQEAFWRRPEEGRIAAVCATVCTAPDFTVWLNDPAPWREYQAWRSAVVASYWAAAGCTVLPVVSFRSMAHRWVLPGSAWAVRSPNRAADVVAWHAELFEFVQVARPALLVMFGRRVGVPLGVPVLHARLFSSKGFTAQKEGAAYGGPCEIRA